MGFVRKHHSELLLLLLPAAGFLVLAIVAPGLVGHEARVIEGACREALAGTAAGRQALVSSCWWAPLPLLAALAPALVAQGAPWPVGAVLASALATAGVGVVVWRGIRTSGQGAGGALLLLGSGECQFRGETTDQMLLQQLARRNDGVIPTAWKSTEPLPPAAANAAVITISHQAGTRA